MTQRGQTLKRGRCTGADRGQYLSLLLYLSIISGFFIAVPQQPAAVLKQPVSEKLLKEQKQLVQNGAPNGAPRGEALVVAVSNPCFHGEQIVHVRKTVQCIQALLSELGLRLVIYEDEHATTKNVKRYFEEASGRSGPQDQVCLCLFIGAGSINDGRSLFHFTDDVWAFDELVELIDKNVPSLWAGFYEGCRLGETRKGRNWTTVKKGKFLLSSAPHEDTWAPATGEVSPFWKSVLFGLTLHSLRDSQELDFTSLMSDVVSASERAVFAPQGPLKSRGLCPPRVSWSITPNGEIVCKVSGAFSDLGVRFWLLVKSSEGTNSYHIAVLEGGPETLVINRKDQAIVTRFAMPNGTWEVGRLLLVGVLENGWPQSKPLVNWLAICHQRKRAIEVSETDWQHMALFARWQAWEKR